MPTPTDYVFSVTSDTANEVVVASRLDLEIQESEIITTLEGIIVTADVLTVIFKDPLSTTAPDDVANLTSVVNAHEGEVLDSVEPAINAEGELVTALSGGGTQIGMQAVQVLNTPDISTDLVKSWQLTIAANTTEILDIFIGDDLVGTTGKCYLAGGEYRCRTSATEGSALNFCMVDRNDVLGLFVLYGMSRTKLSGLTFNNGTIDDVQVGDYAVGGTSTATSLVLAKGADFLEIQFHEAMFTDTENITFTRAGSPVANLDCDLGTWDEGDVIVIQESLKDEWIEGFDQRDIHPGGSKEVPEGLYFRVKCFNADLSEELRVKVSLTIGRL